MKNILMKIGIQEHEFTPEISYYTFPRESNTYVCIAGNEPLESDVKIKEWG